MAIITLTTDFGRKDHYVASLKGRIYTQLPDTQIVDISHEVIPYSISEAAFTLNQAYQHFPKDTVHLIGVNSLDKDLTYLVLRYNGHWFISADNGIFNLILRDKKPEAIYEIHVESPNGLYQNFPELKFMANVSVHLAQGGDPSRIGKQIETYRKGIIPLPMVTDQSITATVQHIDHYGNVILNVDRTLFIAAQEERGFRIVLGRNEEINKFLSYQDGTPGDVLCTFNSSDLLQIGIKLSSAQQLLGMTVDQRILIEFT